MSKMYIVRSPGAPNGASAHATRIAANKDAQACLTAGHDVKIMDTETKAALGIRELLSAVFNRGDFIEKETVVYERAASKASVKRREKAEKVAAAAAAPAAAPAAPAEKPPKPPKQGAPPPPEALAAAEKAAEQA